MDNQDLKQRIKSNFQTGKIPTQSQFYELIDAALNANAARLTEGTLDNARLPGTVDLTQNSDASSLKVKKISGTDINITGDISANTITGDGSGLKNLNASELQSGSIANDQLPETIDLTKIPDAKDSALKAKTITVDDLKGTNALFSETVTAKNFIGTTLKGTTFTGTDATFTKGQVDSLSGKDAKFSEQLEAKNLKGDGSQLTDLNADKIATGTVSNDRLTKANKTQPGITRFATQAEVAQGKDANLAVTPKQMKDAISSTKSNLEKEIGLLQAGVKFKQGVATVMTDSFNLEAGHDFPVIDSYQIKTGDRVLFTNQSDNKQNRVYVASEGNLWTLATDFDSNPDEELFIGLSVEVMEGSDLQHSIWTVTNLENPAAPELTWQKRNDINNYQAGDGIKIEGLKISTDFKVDDLLIDDIKTELKIFGDDDLIDSKKLPDASETVKGGVSFATNDEALTGQRANNVISPATLAHVLKERVFKKSPKKNVLLTDDVITGYQALGTIANQFIYSDYAVTSQGTNLFVTREYQSGMLRVYQWNGSFVLLETINNDGSYSYFRLARWENSVVLYAGTHAYLFNESTKRFEDKGGLQIKNGNALSTSSDTKYGVAYDGKFRVAVLNNKTDTYVYEVPDTTNPQLLINPIKLPFPDDDADAITLGSGLKPFSFDGSEEYGLLSYTQSFFNSNDPILLTRLKPGQSSFETIYSAQKPNGESHGGNVLVYKEHPCAIHGNNQLSSFGRFDSGTYQKFPAYSGGIGGGELFVFALNDRFFTILPGGSGALIYEVYDTVVVKRLEIPGMLTTTLSVGLAIFDGKILIINGNTRQVMKLLMG